MNTATTNGMFVGYKASTGLTAWKLCKIEGCDHKTCESRPFDLFEPIPAKNNIEELVCVPCGESSGFVDNRPPKPTQDEKTLEFIEKAREKNPYFNNYDYSWVEYEACNKEVKIWCKIHLEFFLKKPTRHLCGNGCNGCSKERSANFHRSSNEQFIEKAKQVHGDSFNYSLVVYEHSKKDVKIQCCACLTIFLMRPNNHLQGSGCPECAKGIRAEVMRKFALDRRKTIEQFIEESKQVHGDEFDYSLVTYVDALTPVKITCSQGHIFEQTPNNHLNGNGCDECLHIRQSILFTLTTQEFVKKATSLYGDTYDYSRVDYKGCWEPVIIGCKIHSIWYEQVATYHLKKPKACPKCSKWTTEQKCREIFENLLGVEFPKLYPKWLKNPESNKYLELDGYNSSLVNETFSCGLGFEYNGQGHYHFIPSWCHSKGIHELQTQIEHDLLKEAICADRGVCLIVIPYWEQKRLEEFIRGELVNHKFL